MESSSHTDATLRGRVTQQQPRFSVDWAPVLEWPDATSHHASSVNEAESGNRTRRRSPPARVRMACRDAAARTRLWNHANVILPYQPTPVLHSTIGERGPRE